MKPQKQCNHAGCKCLVAYSYKYCDKHKQLDKIISVGNKYSNRKKILEASRVPNAKRSIMDAIIHVPDQDDSTSNADKVKKLNAGGVSMKIRS